MGKGGGGGGGGAGEEDMNSGGPRKTMLLGMKSFAKLVN